MPAMKLIMENWKRFLKEGDDIAELLDLYLDNPLDFAMPEEVAFHPKIMKARREGFREEYDKCAEFHGENPNPMAGGFKLDPLWSGVTDHEEKKKELNRLDMRINDLLGSVSSRSERQDIIQNSSEFKKLNARAEELRAELSSGEKDQFELGRDLSRSSRERVSGNLDYLSQRSDICPYWATGGTGKPARPGEALAAAEKEWVVEYQREKKIAGDRLTRADAAAARQQSARAGKASSDSDREERRQRARDRSRDAYDRERERSQNRPSFSGQDVLSRRR